MSHALRAGLPPLPDRLRYRPVDRRGFPVPYFLCDQDAAAAVNGGNWDFRLVQATRAFTAVRHDICWICGHQLGAVRVFVLGPMCAINRVSTEPPCHPDCAEFSAKACPFLSNPRATRRDGGKPDDVGTPGIMLERNPGVVMLWPTRRGMVEIYREARGVLFRLGDPVDNLRAYAEGRTATVAELQQSIVSGLPAFRDAALQQAKVDRMSDRWAYRRIVVDAKEALRTFERWLPANEAMLDSIWRGVCDLLPERAA